MNYSLGDFFTRFRNAVNSGSKTFSVPETKLIASTAECLKRMGYIGEIKKAEKVIALTVAYKNKSAVLITLKNISRPGLRSYMTVDQLEKRRKPTTLILSTSKGILSAKEAIKSRVGGEVLAEIL